MKILITLVLLIAGTIAFAQNEGTLLKKAFKKKSDTQLYQFLQQWHEEIPPVSDTEWAILTDLQQETYLVFTTFYQPDRIDLLGGSEWGNDIYQEVKFLIVQNFIEIYESEKVYYSEEEKEDYVTNFIKTNVEADSTQQRLLQRDNEGKLSKDVIDLFASNDMLMLGRNDHLVDSISNFRPAIKSENKLPLYLSRKYSDILYSFLGNRHSPMGKDGIMKPAYSKRKSAKREAFLERYIKIWQGHWGGFWLLHSYPTATSITFDQNREFARVDFTMVYEGGEAILKKEQGNWVLVSAYRIWIE